MTAVATLVPWQSMLTLLLASAVIMGSPGPSTMSVTAVGAAYGFRRSLPYAGGLILGTTAVLLAVAIGVVAILLSIPHGAPVLLTLSAIYILYLAFQIATAPPLSRQDTQVAAPVLILLTDHAHDAVAKVALLTLMIVIIHLGWLVVGASMARVLHDPTLSRIVNVILAVLLVATTALAVLR
jgi:threonine/homoserine/homoserine lactone efflux protein